jgi:hypothetical protein
MSCQEMPAVDRTAMARVFNETMQTLRQDGVKFEHVLLLVRIATPDMEKSLRVLVSYPKPTYVTCVAHACALHRVC